MIAASTAAELVIGPEIADEVAIEEMIAVVAIALVDNQEAVIIAANVVILLVIAVNLQEEETAILVVDVTVVAVLAPGLPREILVTTKVEEGREVAVAHVLDLLAAALLLAAADLLARAPHQGVNLLEEKEASHLPDSTLRKREKMEINLHAIIHRKMIENPLRGAHLAGVRQDRLVEVLLQNKILGAGLVSKSCS